MYGTRFFVCFLFFAIVLSQVLADHIPDDEPLPDDGVDPCFDHRGIDNTPYEGYTHDHDITNMPNHPVTSGTHTHEGTVKEFFTDVGGPYGHGCGFEQGKASLGDMHDRVEPDLPPPPIEGFREPSLLICTGGPCLERDPIQIIGPVDLDGNLPPEPEPGDLPIFYPSVVVDGKIYWDSEREPYQVSQEVLDAETPPDGYKLEDINGQLFLVPYENPAAAPPDQTTLIIYKLIERSDGWKSLQPTPFHVHPVDDPENMHEVSPTPFDTPPTETPIDNQDPTGIQSEEIPQSGESPQSGEGGTFASLGGKFYQVTLNPPIPIQVTEYMIQTWGDGQGKLPQWIELYNPNDLAVNIAGYEFTYVFKKEVNSVKLRHFLIPPESAVILATHIPLQWHQYGGISELQVYNLKIENALKKGWSLKDADGNLIISQTGKIFGEIRDPIAPSRVGLSRVSHNVYVSESPDAPSFFGFRKDVSSPGFYEPQIPRSPALLRQKMRTTWASFKKK